MMQTDPQEVQREHEALQKVVSDTSAYVLSADFRLWTYLALPAADHLTDVRHLSHLVDIFTANSQDSTPSSTAMFPRQDSQALRFLEALGKVSGNNSKSKRLSGESLFNVSDGWSSGDEEAGDPRPFHPGKSDEVGPLTEGFSDGEATP